MTRIFTKSHTRSYNRYPDEKGTERTYIPNRLTPLFPVTTATPMKRGLKDGHSCWTGGTLVVTTATPMKRGLKAEISLPRSPPPNSVTTATPMKRGLKAWTVPFRLVHILVTTATPMKRGLKGLHRYVRIHYSDLSYNRYPDEKGTERTCPNAGDFKKKCYNRYPDEKGTERCNFRM